MAGIGLLPHTFPAGNISGEASDRSADLVEAVLAAWNLAAMVVAAECIKAAKAKGLKSRPLSDDRVRRVVRDRQVHEFREAATATGGQASDSMHHALRIIQHLQDKLTRAMRGPGRPRRVRLNLDGDAPTVRLTGQDRARVPLAGASELRKFYGLKLRLYVRRRRLAPSITLEAALSHLRRETYAEFGDRSPESMTKALDAFVKDRAAAQMPKAAVLFGVAGGALAKRMQRARQKFSVILPAGGI